MNSTTGGTCDIFTTIDDEALLVGQGIWETTSSGWSIRRRRIVGVSDFIEVTLFSSIGTLVSQALIPA